MLEEHRSKASPKVMAWKVHKHHFGWYGEVGAAADPATA